MLIDQKQSGNIKIYNYPTINFILIINLIFSMGCGESHAQNTYTPGKTTDKFERFFATELSKTQTQTEARGADQKTKRKGRLYQQELTTAYQKVQGNLQKFFDELSQRISQYYMQLSADGIQSMTQHRLTQIQTKVYLSEQFLLQTFDILRVIGIKLNYEYQLDMFKTFNKSQTVLINYIKEKYPRAGNIFVPGDLTQVFREFNMLENPENDILRNAGICFLDSSEEAIIKKLKQFFNILIDELDNKFPIFHNLLQERVFSRIVDGKKIIFNYKIGRKLPENTAKFQADEGDQLTITSPQLFRMIIKWVGELEQYFNFPQDEVNEKQVFKTYTVDKQEVFFDDITPDEFDQLGDSLKAKLKQVNVPFKQSIHSLLKQMDMFNINLLKILFTTERKQKYVPKHEAQVIKFAMYNTKLISWLLAEKLITVLKNLINVGAHFQQTSIGKRLDLIKFNVSDLFRAMTVGNRKQILIVYENLKKLEDQGKIKIIKIKNRLGTPLNDAMILFTFKQSFILCELQLILSDSQGVSDKVKNIQVLNHFLYELVRSPNGVLSEVAVLLGYKDNKINYQDKISFENKAFTDFKKCDEDHPESVQYIKVQKKPFICSNCTQFYHPFQNIFGLKRCQKCFLFQCCRCMFKNNKDLQQNQIHQRFTQELAWMINDERARKGNFNSLSKDITIDDILRCFYKKKIFFKNIFKKNFQKLKPRDLQDYIKKNEFQLEQNLQITSIYFILVQFKGESTFIKPYYWNIAREEIQPCLGSTQNFYQMQKIGLSNYDFIMFLRIDSPVEYKPQALEKTVKLCIKPEFQYQNVKKLYTMKIQTKNRELGALLIIKVEMNQSQKIEGIDQEEQQIALKKDFLFTSISEARKSLPKVGLVHENFAMKNFGITTPLINDYFAKSPEKLKIRTLNLTNNKITDIQIILNECLNLEILMLSKNFIKNVVFVKPLKNLTKFVIFQNKIAQISGLANTPLLKKLNLQNNKLKNLQVLTLKSLQQFIISDNEFQSFEWLQKSTLPELQTLIASNGGLQQRGEENKSYKFTFPRLKKIDYRLNPTKQLNLQCPNLRFLYCESSSLTKLSYSSTLVEYLQIGYNAISNLDHIVSQNVQKMKRINACGAGALKNFPKISSQTLEVLILNQCQIQQIINLDNSHIPKLTELQLASNLFKDIPQLSFPNLKILTIANTLLESLQNLSDSEFPLLQQIDIYGNMQIVCISCPQFKFPALTNLKLQKFSFSTMQPFQRSQLPNLIKFQLSDIKVRALPKLTFEKLNDLTLNYCVVQDYSSFNQSVFPQLETLSLYSLSTDLPEEQLDQNKCFNKVSCPKLKQMNIYSCSVVKIQGILACQMPNLQNCVFSYSKCKSLPVMNFPKLLTMSIQTCELSDIKNITSSSLNKLEELQLEGNKIQQIPKIRLPSLKILTISSNLLTNVSKLNHSEIPMLQNLNLDRNQLIEFPQLHIPSLKQISMADNSLKNLKGLHSSKMNNLQFLSISNCMQLQDTEFPVLDLPKVTYITFNNCKITSLKNLERSKLPRLETLQFDSLKVKSLPILKLPKLNTFVVSGGYEPDPEMLINDISNINKWQCPELVSLSIINTSVEIVPYMNFPKLQKIEMNSNKLTNVSALKTSQLPELCQVSFNYNTELSELPQFPFNCLIDSLNCNYCAIQSIPDMPDLKVKNLYLTGCRLKQLGKMDLSQTQYLAIDSNQIQDISIFLKEANKMQYLYINCNQIKSIPDIDFPHLQSLSANDNLLTSISLKQKNFPSLTSAALENNQIQKIGQITCPLLSIINLANNKLTAIDFFKKQVKLKFSELKIENNEISKIDYLPSATYVYLSNNKLKNLNWVQNSSHEQWYYAHFNQNQIQDVSGLFNKNCNLKDLYYLVLDNNKIKNVSFNTPMPTLYSLSLAENQIQTVDNMNNSLFPALGSLTISGNKLKKFGPNISLKSLSSLYLQNNPDLHQIKGLNSPGLTTICLSTCGLNNLDWLKNLKLPDLTTLQVDSNNLAKLPKIDMYPNLFYLYIQNNPIQKIDEFLSCANAKNLSCLEYSLKQDLALQTKKQMKQKITEVNSSSSCLNNQLMEQQYQQQQQQQQEQGQQSGQEQQMGGQGQEIMQRKQTPQLLNIDDEIGNEMSKELSNKKL